NFDLSSFLWERIDNVVLINIHIEYAGRQTQRYRLFGKCGKMQYIMERMFSSDVSFNEETGMTRI
ncbi:hypothetical protein CJD29_08885, partial [Bacillus licheniformis]|uniref:hypothetical protein n=1 Tax=Bacillus licheniformis TaxID=1402 RepID=UPI000BCCC895